MKDADNLVPIYFKKFFHWICHDDYIEELEGDLLENFIKNKENQGLKYARKQYRKEILFMIRPSVIKSFNLSPSSYLNMAILGSHLKVATRNIRRHKIFSLLNISGLAIGMTVSLLIIALLSDLLKFDHFHSKKESIYRVITDANYDYNREDQLATSPQPLYKILTEDIPGIDQVTQIRRFFSADATANNKIIPLKGHLVDEKFLDIFSFPLLAGNPKTVLSDPYSLVITEKAAHKLFSNENPIGQIVKMGSFGNFKINGVLKDIPKNSHLQFEVLGSFSTLAALEKNELVSASLDKWGDIYSNYNYLLLNEYGDVSAVESTLNKLTTQHYAQLNSLSATFSLQSLLSIVPGPELSNKIGPTMTFIPLIILSVIAFLILISACFNYTNLSIARALKRSKEVGLRKVIGARKYQITLQFLIESVVISLISLGIAILLFQMIRPGFYRIIPRADQFNLNLDPRVIVSFIIFAIFSGILAGVIPSLFLSRIKPVLVLKNMVSEKVNKRFTLRRVLITFQFTISIIFIVGASIVYKQYKFALNKDFGFDQENILNIELFDTDYQLLKNEISKIPEVRNISFCSNIAGLGSTNSAWLKINDGADSLRSFFIATDHSYLKNHGMSLIAGEDFQPILNGQLQHAIIVNQAFLSKVQWDAVHALDEIVSLNDELYRITGVVKEFNYTHLEEPIGPFFFIPDAQYFNTANLKIASTDIAGTMSQLEDVWVNLQPNNSFTAAFLQEQLDNSYDFLKNAMTLFSFLAFLAISIACLGMLGMAMFSAETRAKEVSIRKIFGASIWQIFFSLSRRFYILLAIASFIAIPIVYLLFDQVILANFAFRVNIGPVELLSGLVIVLFLGLASIGSQTWRVAKVNPADTLRGF